MSVRSLRRDEQFANLSHANRALAEQMVGDGALNGIFREPERIARRYPMVDHRVSGNDPFRLTENSVQRAITGHLLGDRAVGMAEVGELILAA